MKATLSLIKQRIGKYGDGCFISPIKDSHCIIWLSFHVRYGWIISWRNFYGNITLATVPMFRFMCAEFQVTYWKFEWR